MSSAKHMVRIPAGPGAKEWTGPVLVRGWLQVRRPWRHPIAVLTLIAKWRRVKRDVDHDQALRSFEYWQRLESLVLGMHVGWSSQEALDQFHAYPSHRDIAKWASNSRLVCAMKLETMGLDASGAIVHLGGFYIGERDAELPNDALFPRAPFQNLRVS
jgi:hypothetical protein